MSRPARPSMRILARRAGGESHRPWYRGTLALALAASCFSIAWARAGGGEHYPGGGGGPSGGGDGGAGDGWAIYWLIRLLFDFIFSGNPISILILVVIVVAITIAARQGRLKRGVASLSGVFTPGPGDDAAADASAADPAAQPAPDPAQGLQALKTADPNFSEHAFLDMVQTAFYAIQQGWAKKDLTGGRMYLSDALQQRFAMQLEQMKQQGRTDMLEDLVVGRTDILAVGREGEFDTITVRISAGAKDYTVDDATGRIVDGSKEEAPFVEDWTWMRRVGVPTRRQGLSAKTCPACGAPLKMNQAGACAYCGAQVSSMDFEWALTSIQQVG